MNINVEHNRFLMQPGLNHSRYGPKIKKTISGNSIIE